MKTTLGLDSIMATAIKGQEINDSTPQTPHTPQQSPSLKRKRGPETPGKGKKAKTEAVNESLKSNAKAKAKKAIMPMKTRSRSQQALKSYPTSPTYWTRLAAKRAAEACSVQFLILANASAPVPVALVKAPAAAPPAPVAAGGGGAPGPAAPPPAAPPAVPAKSPRCAHNDRCPRFAPLPHICDLCDRGVCEFHRGFCNGERTTTTRNRNRR